MKKALSMFLVAALAMSMTACGGSEKPAENAAPATEAAATEAAATEAAAETEAAEEAAETEAPAEESAAPAAADYLSGNYAALPADGPQVDLTLGHAMQENSDSHQMLLELKAALEKYSDGKITLTIYPNGQLGSDSEMIASNVAGDIDMVYQSGATHATFVPETTIFDAPFILAGYDSAVIEKALTDSEFRTMFNEASEKGGLTCLMMRASGATYLTANKEVYSMDDLKGLKVRTAQSESRMAVWAALGANPTPLSFSELYMALQNGTVEAQDNMLSNIVNSALFEVQHYLIPTKMATPEFELTMNAAKFHSLPQEYQDMIAQICTELTAYDFAVSNRMEDIYFNQLLTECGMELCDVSPEFLQAMTEAEAPTLDTVKASVANDALFDALAKSLAE